MRLVWDSMDWDEMVCFLLDGLLYGIVWNPLAK